MNKWQAAVRDFHAATDSTIGDTPQIRDAELRARLIAEEAAETIAALGFEVATLIRDEKRGGIVLDIYKMGHADLIEVADGIADSIYVLLGTAVACGLDMDPIFDEVHRSNMSKLPLTKRADGKVLKSENYTPPNLAPLVDAGVPLEVS